MTVVAIWFEPMDQGIWAVADTRISVPLPGGGISVRTDSASKLFTLGVACRPVANEKALFPPPHWNGRFGFAFAGDSLPALMTFATATTCLGNLRSMGPANPPTLRSIAEVVRRLGTRFGKEVAASRNGTALQLEIVVFGWCPVLQRLAIYTLTSDQAGDPLNLIMKEILPQTNEEVVLLGSGAIEASGRIENLRADGVSLRAPMIAVRRMVAGGDMPNVGGNWSMGFASHALGFEPFAAVVPVPGGGQKAMMSLNGIDTDQEIGQVGDYVVSFLGLA